MLYYKPGKIVWKNDNLRGIGKSPEKRVCCGEPGFSDAWGGRFSDGESVFLIFAGISELAIGDKILIEAVV